MKISQDDKEMIELIALGVAEKYARFYPDTAGLADHLYSYCLPCLKLKVKRFKLDNNMRDWLIVLMRHWAVAHLIELHQLNGSVRTEEIKGAWYATDTGFERKYYALPSKKNLGVKGILTSIIQ